MPAHLAALALFVTLLLAGCGGGGGGAGDDPIGMPSLALDVTVTGNGRVVSQPAGIDCGSTCSARFASGSNVLLSATAAGGQSFAGWGGACRGSAPTCSVAMNAAGSVTASFTAQSAAGWTDTVALSAAGAEQPRAAIDAAGNATAIWRQLDTGVFRHSVWASRRPAGGTWSTPVVLESSDNDVGDAALAVDPLGGRAMVVWSEQAGTAFELRARAADATGAWGPIALIGGPARAVARIAAGWDGAGTAVAIWNQTDAGSTNSVWSNRFAAGAWGAAVRVANDGAQDLDPSLAVAGSGRAFVVWSRLGSGIWASHADDGVWAAPVQLAAGLINVDLSTPRVAADVNGNAVAVWSRSVTSPGQFATQLVSRRFAAGAWSAGPAPLYPAVATNVFSEARLAVNGQGRFAAVWGLRDGSVQAAQSDTGATWGTADRVQAAGSELRSVPDLGIDAQGEIVALWAARATGASIDALWLSRFSAGAWSAPALHQQGSEAIATPRLAVNARGDAVAVWLRFGGDGSRVVSRSLAAAR